MDIVVKGRQGVVVPDHYRQHVSEKLAKAERYDNKVIRIDVELAHERNPRQADLCQRVELTCVSKGPVVRAEACSDDFYSALDKAITKLEARLRRAADRRRVHHGLRTPTRLAELPVNADTPPAPVINGRAPATGDEDGPDLEQLAEAFTDGPQLLGTLVVREKTHPATPMSLEDALHEMELVGHDFYLFVDAATGNPSVVYRRRGYDYGVIRLRGGDPAATDAGATDDTATGAPPTPLQASTG